jgi:citrate synthase
MADTLTLTDNRTGRSYELPIQDETIRAADLRKVRVNASDLGLMTYDPALVNTAACRSRISYIDGDAGILRYRGYPIEQLAEKSSFLEVALLLLDGELPSQAELDAWKATIHDHRVPPARIQALFDGLAEDPHPMGALIAAFGALGTFYPEAHKINDADVRAQSAGSCAGAGVALTPRKRRGEPVVPPAEGLSFAGNFLHMLKATPGQRYEPHPCSSARSTAVHPARRPRAELLDLRDAQRGQLERRPYSSVAAATAALYGPLHARERSRAPVLHTVGSLDKVPAFISSVKKGEGRLMGFGHRIYKSYDRARASSSS